MSPYGAAANAALAVLLVRGCSVSGLGERLDHLTLVSYSGGGAVATLVAARRNDVHNLVTVAGVLDHELWTRNHHLSPSTGSLNLADVWPGLTNIAQSQDVGLADDCR